MNREKPISELKTHQKVLKSKMSDWYKSSERTDYLGREISLDSFDYSVSKSLFGLVLISPRNRSFFDQTKKNDFAFFEKLSKCNGLKLEVPRY